MPDDADLFYGGIAADNWAASSALAQISCVFFLDQALARDGVSRCAR